MSHKIKLLLLATVILVVGSAASAYFLSSSKISGSAEQKEAPKVDQAALEDNYKIKAKSVVSDFAASMQSGQFAAGKIEQSREILLGLTVPAKFKDLHIELVLALDRMDEFVKTGDASKKTISEEMIAKAKANYEWLN